MCPKCHVLPFCFEEGGAGEKETIVSCLIQGNQQGNSVLGAGMAEDGVLCPCTEITEAAVCSPFPLPVGLCVWMDWQTLSIFSFYLKQNMLA